MAALPTSLEAEGRSEDSADLGPDGPRPHRVRRFLAALRRDVPTVLSAAYIVLVIIMAMFAPLIVKVSGWGFYKFDQSAIDPSLGGLPLGTGGGISGEHWFGVEPGNGRDIFARIVYGARISMTIALSATLLTSALGVVFGLLSGYFGGMVDAIISRLMEFLMAFPALIFMIAVLSALPAENRQVLLVLVITIFGWPYLARIVRTPSSRARRGRSHAAPRASVLRPPPPRLGPLAPALVVLGHPPPPPPPPPSVDHLAAWGVWGRRGRPVLRQASRLTHSLVR